MSSESPSKKPNFQILPVVNKYLKTTQKGSNHWAVCPFHQDSSPSLSVSEEKNIFKCFACDVSGDAVGFVMRIEKCSYAAAIKKIGTILGIDINPFLNKKENANQKLYRINEIIANSYHRCLFNKENQKHLEYLTETRKLKIETIEKYKLGFAPKENILEHVFRVYMDKKENWGEADIRKTNIFTYKKDGTKEPYFKERIIFPIFDLDRQIIAFSGRGDNPKYLNIKTNEIFSKRNALFNIQNLQNNRPIYVYEGFLDLIKADQIGIDNGVACMGGTIDVNIYEIFKRYSKIINLTLDNDSAGFVFTTTIAKSLISHGFQVNVVDLLDTDAKDIDELINKDEQLAISKLKSPISFFAWMHKKESPKDLDSLQALIKDLLNIIFSGDYVRPRIEPFYARNAISMMFSWYKRLPEYSENNLEDLVEERYEHYKKIIERGAILPQKDRATAYEDPIDIQEEPQEKQEDTETVDYRYKQITDPFIRHAIKYQGIVSFYRENKEIIDSHSEWLFNVPEEFILPVGELKLIFDSFNIEEKKFNDEGLEKLKEFAKFSSEIKGEDDFFNKYYSFHKGYFKLLKKFYIQEKDISYEERWEKSTKVKKMESQFRAFTKEFFRKSPFYKKLD